MDGAQQKKDSGQPLNAMACRESARGILQRKIDRELRRIAALEILIKAIPWKLLSKNDEEILWSYFCER